MKFLTCHCEADEVSRSNLKTGSEQAPESDCNAVILREYLKDLNEILRGVYHEQCNEILRYAQNDRKRGTRNDKKRRAQNDTWCQIATVETTSQ
ncbi:MAG: hypothetical protein V1764_00295 [Nitrospirota bacterium]